MQPCVEVCLSDAPVQIALAVGANETMNSRDTVEAQVAEISRITGGKFARVFDATTYGGALALQALKTVSTSTEKWLATVDDW